MAEYQYIVDFEGLKRYQSLFESEGSTKQIEVLDWFHIQNVLSEMHIVEAVIDAETAAIYTVFPMQFQINGNIHKAGQSIDTFTASKFRGQGLFILLAKDLFKKLKNESYELVYGFPNKFSAKGFFKGLKWTSLGYAPFLVKPYRTGYFLAKFFKKTALTSYLDFELFWSKKTNLKTNQSITFFGEFNEQHTAVWQAFSKDIPVAVHRDAQYLNWRFSKKPFETYKAIQLKIDQEIVAFLVYTIKNKHEGSIGYLMEYIYNPKFEKESRVLINEANNAFIKEKVDAALVWCHRHTKTFGAFRKAFFFVFPPKFRPIELNFGVLPFNEAHKDLLGNAENWYISYADSDTV